MYTTQNEILKVNKIDYSCVFLYNEGFLELKTSEVGLSPITPYSPNTENLKLIFLLIFLSKIWFYKWIWFTFFFGGGTFIM